LKELESTTRTKTTRAQNEVLRSLPDADLIVVALKNGDEHDQPYQN
jgi:hypothetical protein